MREETQAPIDDGRKRKSGAPANAIPWRERPLTTMQAAAKLAGLSVASLYRLASEGKLSLVRLAGRTLIETPTLIRVVEGVEPWTPSPRTGKACERRKELAQEARERL